jgi:uncharacterized membrane protein
VNSHLQVATREDEENAESVPSLPKMFSVLLAAGLAIFFIGVILLAVAASLSGTSNSGFGVVIFLGPIPIVAGAGPGTLWILLIAVLLAVLIVMAFLLERERSKVARRCAGPTPSSLLRRRTYRGILEPALCPWRPCTRI